MNIRILLKIHITFLVLLEVALGATASPYIPADVRCPEKPLIRSASDGLSESESSWIQQRDIVTHQALLDWLNESELRDFDPSSFLSTISHPDVGSTIRIGLSFSGGGFRAMLNGAGMLAAFDNRTKGATKRGGSLGGLLQASSYITGLSGGSWLVASVASNDWKPISSLQTDQNIWNFENSFNPTTKHRSSLPFQLGWGINIAESVSAKGEAGYPISITDVWGRMLSAQMLPGPDSGSELHWSSLQNTSYMEHHTMPMPLLVADSVAGFSIVNKNDTSGNKVTSSGDVVVTLNSTVYEISPFEFGSWDPSVYSFIETRYLGTEFNDGVPATTDCTIGYDNTGFLMGASSTLFNLVVQGFMNAGGILQNFYADIIKALGGPQFLEIAVIGSNPFEGISDTIDYVRNSKTLSLVDGGEDGQNIPLAPLIQRERAIDIIFALDNSADTKYNWPSGAAMYATYKRQFLPQGNSTAFPYIPEPSHFLASGLTQQPTFFGCAAGEVAKDGNGIDSVPPLVVYLANADRGYASNTSTWKLNYSDKERDNMIRNGYNVATQRNGTMDPEWRSCVACAVILREQQRRGDSPTTQCKGCLQRYCYDKPE